MEKIFIKFIKSFIYIMFIISSKFKNQNLNQWSAKKFIDVNNKYVLKMIKKKRNDKILILLPHCLQFYDCEYKVTTNIKNCKKCGKCVISDFIDVMNKFPKNLEIKIATGGTLARKYVKSIKPSIIIAVACKRDLITGIRDSEPFLVYGIFNKICCEACINTTVSIEEIYSILEIIT